MSRQSNEVERRGQNWQTWNKQSDVLLEGDGHHEEATNSQVKTLRQLSVDDVQLCVGYQMFTVR